MTHTSDDAPDARPPAKPSKGIHRRDLPHLQPDESAFLVTFCTWQRWELPESARSLVLDHCLHDHGTKLWACCAVIMPEHVHMVMAPMRDAAGQTYGMSEVLKGIKGASARSVNAALGRTGPVWQPESFDHALRRHEKVVEKVDYICQNPVRRGLAASPDEYPWLWRERTEGPGRPDVGWAL